MKRESGDKHFPIWLLGDSEPKRWQNVIDTPLDPRHAVRHIIWTPVLDVIQDRIFRKLGKRIDTSSIFIRNAIEDSSKKPRQNDIDWKQYVKMEIAKLKELISQHNPKIVLCFGAFSFEFARRALNQQPNRNYRYWGARRLGHEFRSRIAQFDFKKTNILPMLHRSVGGGKFLQSHEYFCNQEGANYFDFVGTSIAGKILENYDKLQIWV